MIKGTLVSPRSQIGSEFWFNRVFPAAGGSWTRAMRPDFSADYAEGEGAGYAETWIHFGAKYRVETITQLFGVPRPANPGRAVRLLQR